MSEIANSTLIYYRREICSHSAVESVAPVDVKGWTVVRARRNNKLNDVVIIMVDGYEFSEAQADALPPDIDFVLLTRAEGDGFDADMAALLRMREIGIGKLGALKRALGDGSVVANS